MSSTCRFHPLLTVTLLFFLITPLFYFHNTTTFYLVTEHEKGQPHLLTVVLCLLLHISILPGLSYWCHHNGQVLCQWIANSSKQIFQLNPILHSGAVLPRMLQPLVEEWTKDIWEVNKNILYLTPHQPLGHLFWWHMSKVGKEQWDLPKRG